ncbi:hypothetical protein [Nocardia aurea]|uniref:hypothetical protein n=1 Tax=Nocardia aurea TaxID=2144174 RepID=UPI0033B5DA1C
MLDLFRIERRCRTAIFAGYIPANRVFSRPFIERSPVVARLPALILDGDLGDISNRLANSMERSEPAVNRQAGPETERLFG